MIYDHNGGIRDPLKEDLPLEFCRHQNKVISIFTETHINHDQIYHIRNNWLGSNFLSQKDNAKECLSDWRVDTDLKGRFVFFRFTPSNDRVSCVDAPSAYNAREQLARGRFFEGLQNEDLRRMENPHSPEFNRYDRSFGKDPG